MIAVSFPEIVAEGDAAWACQTCGIWRDALPLKDPRRPAVAARMKDALDRWGWGKP